jgi:flagellar hook assembly protein FlgD
MQLTQAVGLIGHTVSVNSADAAGNSSTITGKIAGVSVVNGTPQFALTDRNGKVIVDANGNPLTFQLSQITGIVQ